MNIEIEQAVLYHGSDQIFDELRPESTITQWRELAEAFSHQPSSLWYDDDGICLPETGHHPGDSMFYWISNHQRD